TAFALQLSPAGGQNIARYIQGIRFGQTGQATVTQPQGLGGASKPIQGIISPRGAAPPGAPQLIASAGSMIDLRNPNDASGNDRTWAMPDVHTELAPGLIALKQNGALQVYSKDHPLAHQAFAQDLHYDGFNASVSVDIARCDPDDAADALVIRGEMSMTLPNLGDSTDPDGVIAASFKLCDTSLRSVHLQFNSPIGLPIGSTGLFMTSLEGGVDIYANHTTIQFDIALQAAPGSDGGGLKIQGGVFIDTLGMFEFQGSGSLLSGALSVDGSLWVGWNPLDVGFSVEIKYLGWLKGFANAHMWKGQGFNHRYAWLPDDDETHITGEIGAELKIKQGAIFTTELLDMPPGDVVITLKLAFGQFCTSADCTKFEWGIKGTFEILDYPIGVYYTFGRDLDHPEISLSNISFIIGNDGYTLIDRYGGAQPWPTLRGTPASPATDGARLIAYGATGTITATETFTVTEQTEQVLAGLGWRAGAPNLSLIAPDGTRLEGADATAYTTVISNTGQQILLSMQHPDDDQLAWAGTWQAEISNLGDEPFVENYQFVAFMNSGAPGTASDYRFLSAGARMTANANAYTIAWAVPANAAQAAPHSTISLFYTRVDDPAAASGNLGARVPIRSNLPLTAGSYNWNMQGLPSGTYQISAVVDDGVNESPFGAGGSPDVCTPLTSGLPPARAFSPERFPGTVAFSSTETIELIDPNPPPTPTGLSLDSLDGALIARWDGPAAADWDTQGYVVAWTQTTPRGAINNEQYVSASSSPAVRIGGVDNSLPVAVQVRAVDASHNLSAAALANGTPSGNSDPLPLQPQNLLTTAVSSTQATFTWQANPAGPTPSSYRVLAVNVVTGAISETTVPGPT
ncbi:MAG TPA: hypothetical protein VD886_01065, partial [Herpetosiphonaceae bacterium]|nr:hypothetical protein [Herpetosiphonaceae bacterium]